MKNILVLNLDRVKNKNLYQFWAMKRYGFNFTVFSYLADSSTVECDNYNVNLYPRSLVQRLLCLFKFLWNASKTIHHIELYTGCGNFLFLEYFLARFFRIPLCVVERGSPLRDIDRYGVVGRCVRVFLLKNADHVWIRELWMIDKLKKYRRKGHFFMGNGVEVSDRYDHSPDKEIDFVWCNSLTKLRRSDWFVDVLKDQRFQSRKAVLLGIVEDNPALREQQEYVLKNKPSNLQVLSFQDPKEYFLRSKFFVLPADFVYINFALLESMSCGVVPIVSDVNGARDIVDDGVDGFVIEHNKDSLREAMAKAVTMSSEQYTSMSKKAREKIIKKFSVDAWAEKLSEFYGQIRALK